MKEPKFFPASSSSTTAKAFILYTEGKEYTTSSIEISRLHCNRRRNQQRNIKDPSRPNTSSCHFLPVARVIECNGRCCCCCQRLMHFNFNGLPSSSVRMPRRWPFTSVSVGQILNGKASCACTELWSRRVFIVLGLLG